MKSLDLVIAITFGVSVRVYHEYRQSEYRWKVLAAEAIATMVQAEDGNWSDEKLSEWLNWPLNELRRLRERFRIALVVEKQDGIGVRMKTHFQEWLKRFDIQSKSEREALADELNLMVVTHLQNAAMEGLTLGDVSATLEGIEPKKGREWPPGGNLNIDPKDSDGPRTWGPQWKD